MILSILSFNQWYYSSFVSVAIAFAFCAGLNYIFSTRNPLRNNKDFITIYYTYKRLIVILVFVLAAITCLWISSSSLNLDSNLKGILFNISSTIFVSLIVSLIYEFYLSDIRTDLEERSIKRLLETTFENTIQQKMNDDLNGKIQEFSNRIDNYDVNLNEKIQEFSDRINQYFEEDVNLNGKIQEFSDRVNKYFQEVVEPHISSDQKKFSELGLNDCYYQLDINKFAQKILRSKEVKIMVMWLPELEILKESILKAIRENDTKVRIILWDYAHVDALRKRSDQFKNETVGFYSTQQFQNDIIKNIRLINIIRHELGVKKDNLEVKKYSGFMACSILGYDDSYIFGLYLYGRLSNTGMQFRVRNLSSKTTCKFYDELNGHFENCWNDSFLLESKDYSAWLLSDQPVTQ